MSGRTVSDKRISLHRPGYSYSSNSVPPFCPSERQGPNSLRGPYSAATIVDRKWHPRLEANRVARSSHRRRCLPPFIRANRPPFPSPLDRRACRPIVVGYWPLSIDRCRARVHSSIQFPRSRADSFEIARQGRLFPFLFVFLARLPLEKLYYLERLLDERVARFVEEETYGWIRVSN